MVQRRGIENDKEKRNRYWYREEEQIIVQRMVKRRGIENGIDKRNREWYR